MAPFRTKRRGGHTCVWMNAGRAPVCVARTGLVAPAEGCHLQKGWRRSAQTGRQRVRSALAAFHVEPQGCTVRRKMAALARICAALFHALTCCLAWALNYRMHFSQSVSSLKNMRWQHGHCGQLVTECVIYSMCVVGRGGYKQGTYVPFYSKNSHSMPKYHSDGLQIAP